MGLAAYVEQTIARVRDTPADRSLLSAKIVPGTIFNGATGVAVFCLEVIRLRGADDALLARAQEWLDLAERWALDATPDDWRRLTRGFISGRTGMAYVDALLSAGRGDRARVHAAVQRIERATERFDDLNETVRSSGVIGGEAGIVVAARDLLARLPQSADYAPTRALLEGIRDRRIASLLALHAAPFIPATPIEPGPRDLLGMAHGIAGEIFTLVTSGSADNESVRARLEEIARLRQIDPNGYTYWLPLRDGGDLALVESWCNGTAGYALLWSEVARLTGSEEALRLAAESARSTAFLMSRNSGLCCGLAGQAIALQRFADVSGDSKYSRRAYHRLARAAEIVEAEQLQGFAFWHGALGVALAALGRIHGEASFPCLELWRRR